MKLKKELRAVKEINEQARLEAKLKDQDDGKRKSNSSSGSSGSGEKKDSASKDQYINKVKQDMDARRESIQDEDNDSRNSTNTDISTTSVGDIVDTSPGMDRLGARPLIPSSDEASLP
ncbi:hypothetical protein JTE90_020583 [Oedothorax gibbosus]|uniref:Uncharacterized protein n=1 Tax=Oedothorax gibbosus TaxID=931172 RepID=A0AAV6VWG0_9ARAC|nr:hypothetical protein JTE90_020583 [Oedothorax gibbosus]